MRKRSPEQLSREIRKGAPEDLARIKQLADSEKHALGFITRGTVREALADQAIFVALVNTEVVGFIHFYHRKRDEQTTLYKMMVQDDFRRLGLGRLLLNSVREEAEQIGKGKLLLKCPVDLSSNAFFGNYGFSFVAEEDGRRRKLNIWIYSLAHSL